MPHGYTIDIDDRQMLKYSKTHKNGERTEVQADQVGTQATGGTEWLVNVKDPNKNFRMGRYGTKKEAKKAMKRWMKKNKKGVQSSSGAVDAMGAMDAGAGNIFSGGGDFL